MLQVGKLKLDVGDIVIIDFHVPYSVNPRMGIIIKQNCRQYEDCNNEFVIYFFNTEFDKKSTHNFLFSEINYMIDKNRISKVI